MHADGLVNSDDVPGRWEQTGSREFENHTSDTLGNAWKVGNNHYEPRNRPAKTNEVAIHNWDLPTTNRLRQFLHQPRPPHPLAFSTRFVSLQHINPWQSVATRPGMGENWSKLALFLGHAIWPPFQRSNRWNIQFQAMHRLSHRLATACRATIHQ